MTNYELMKNMSIEEMAGAIMCPNEIPLNGSIENRVDCESVGRHCQECCFEWLKQEVTE